MQNVLKRLGFAVVVFVAVILMSVQVAYADDAKIGARLPGQFVVDPDGTAMIVGQIVDSAKWGTGVIDPIEGVTVQVFEGVLTESELLGGQHTPIASLITSASGYWSLVVEGVPGDRQEYSILCTKDGYEHRGYNDVSYTEAWPKPTLEVDSLTLRVGDPFDYNMPVDTATYSWFGAEEDASPFLSHNGTVDTSVPGPYDVTYKVSISIFGSHVEDRSGNWVFDVDAWQRGTFLSGYAEKTVTITVLPNESTVTAIYQDQEGNQISDPVSNTGTIGDPYKTEAKVIEGYKLIEMPENSEGTYTEADIQVVYVYEKIPTAIEETPAGKTPAEKESTVKTLAKTGDTATAPVALALGALTTCVLAVAARKLWKQN